MLNAGPGRVDAWGKSLLPANNLHGIADAKIKVNGRLGKVTFTQTFGDDPKFRALYKVALSSLAHWLGPSYVRSSHLDEARRFV